MPPKKNIYINNNDITYSKEDEEEDDEDEDDEEEDDEEEEDEDEDDDKKSYHINENIISQLDNMNKTMLHIVGKIDKMDRHITAIHKELKMIKNHLKIDDDVPIDPHDTRVIKEESLDIPENTIMNALFIGSVESDCRLFKKYYIDDVKIIPIKYVNMRNMKYWNGDKWCLDISSIYLKKVIIGNIRRCYYKVNKFETYKNNMDQFLINQSHIQKLSNDKYINKLFKKIRSEIINSSH